MRITVYPDPSNGSRYLVSRLYTNEVGSDMACTERLTATCLDDALAGLARMAWVPPVLGEPTVLGGGRAVRFDTPEVIPMR